MTIDLGPLRHAEAVAFTAATVDATSAFAMTCIERAEGNPLFLDQLLRTAEEAADKALPGSIQSIVLARMDVLPPEDRRALQAASVLGHCRGCWQIRATGARVSSASSLSARTAANSFSRMHSFGMRSTARS